jgi:hypothetical protein
MSLRKAAELLKTAKRAAKDDAALGKTIQAVEYILDHVTSKERKESDARLSPRAIRTVIHQR